MLFLFVSSGGATCSPFSVCALVFSVAENYPVELVELLKKQQQS